MEKILQEWLKRRLNIHTQWDTDVENVMKNGYVVASILHNYNIINDEKCRLILMGSESKHIKSNWNLLREWLRDVGIIMSNEEVESAIKGSKPTILRIFYQLFLFLDKKDRSNFIKQEKMMVSRLVEKPTNRFKVTAANKEESDIEDDLSKPLLNERLFIDWQRKKANEVKEMYEHARSKYLKLAVKPFDPMIEHFHKTVDHNKRDIEKFNSKYPVVFKNYTFDELMALENRTYENPNIIDSDWTKQYMNNLLSRMNKKSDSEEFQKQMIKSITTTTWNSLIEDSEFNHDAELAKEIMKLSQFEKQMCTQLMETKQQVRNLICNRIVAEKEFANERDHQFNVFINSLKEDINYGLLEIDFENQRNQSLHARLYAEKMKRKRKLYFEICYETLLSLVDYATKYSYYKRLMEDIPDEFIHEWKLLYYKQQPIFDILMPIENIVIKSNENDIEEVLRSHEKVRQECLNQLEFTEYIDYLHPWKLDVLLANYDSESEDRKIERMGINILTHVVYNLLELKYPLPPKRPHANLPSYSVKSLIINVPNTSIDSAMQKLLKKQKIFVLRVESCVDFCLKQYKKETIGSVDISIAYDQLTENVKEEEAKELLKNLISYRKVINSKSELSLTVLDNNTKQTQTPKAIPEEDIVLSRAAYLGKQAFEILSSGHSLSNDLIASMLAEYIKEQKFVRGFVLLNYPNTYNEARVLEEIFSGKIPPNNPEYDCNNELLLEEEVETDCDYKEDPLRKFRESKILKLKKKSSDDKFTSYFTSYIKLKKSENINKEIHIWDLTKENCDDIDRFYSAVGANYSMYYENIDKAQLALICRYVIGDFELPLKSDDELFGNNVLDEIEFPVAENKKPKSKIIKTESSNSKSSKQKKKLDSKSSLISNSPTIHADVIKKLVSKEDLKDIEQKSSGKFPTLSNVRNISWKDAEEVLAGDDNWEYAKIQIPTIPGLALASCWEEIERSYVNDIHQLLFSKRLQMHCLVPYTTFIYDKIKQIVMLPSPKQDLVCKFQQEYNSLKDDWRENNITKNEWHCRVKELQRSLYNICDERKKYSEQQKHFIKCENWICDELIILANTFVSLMEKEINRFILTYQILHDYYITVANKSLTQRLPLKELNKFLRDSVDAPSTTKTKINDEKYRQLKEVLLELQLKNITIDSNNNPLNVFIDDNVKLALRCVQDISESHKTLIGHEMNELALKFQSASSSSLRKKLEKDYKIMGESVEAKMFEYIKCIKEWKMGCFGEASRVNLRITVLQKKCYEDMQLFCDNIYKTYKKIQDFINDQYINEIKAVDRLCKYIQMAIEMNKKIPENLLLDGDSFTIDPNVLQMPIPRTDPKIAEDTPGEMEFKLSQLALLRDMFKTVAPTGVAIQQVFIYLLQDYVLFGKESCKGPMFPLMWRRIDPERIPEFVFPVFGDNLYIDWRDFLIYCLNITFPTIEELLETRKKLRCQESEYKELIDREIFLNTQLWFEKEFTNNDNTTQLRNTLLKHFLFELFEVSRDTMNYTALLLAFCKGRDPNEGFSKALALALGKKVCYLTHECEEAVNKLKDIKKLKDDTHEQVLKDVNKFLDLILQNVLDFCAGTIIIELKDAIKNRRKGNGRILSRSKTSTRSSQMGMDKQVSPTGKSDIKMIFTNSPVEKKSDTVYINEKLMNQEVEKPVDHSDIIYSVSRDTIWKVLKVCVPWHFELFDQDECTYKVAIDEIIDKLEQDTEDKSIYVCKFLSEPKVCKFLHRIKKFSKPNMYEEIFNILEE